ncbi:reverse transcriptase domain-containing protein [Tanacetum coccineum]
MDVKNLVAKVYSRLVENQINDLYIAKEQSMIQYMEKAKALINNFRKFLIVQVPRSENKKADTLSKIEEGHSWMTSLLEYLTDITLPAETKKARSIKIKSRQYAVIGGVLYRKSFLEPWLRCVGPLQAEYVIREIHEGSCNMHFGPRTVVAKAIRSGYYWPTMHKDARNIIRQCNDCQVHRPVPKNPQQKLTPITSPWPFYKWGIDISGPFPESQRRVKFLIVVIDYFTKWIEVKPVATITGNQVKKFVWDNIVCRSGLPGEIMLDNGKQFQENPFKDWGEGIKVRLGEKNRNWVEEVSHVLWAHRTMIKTSNGDTLFSLTYGTKAVIPVEIRMPSLRCTKVNQTQNDEALLLNLDILEERREKSAIREAKSKAKWRSTTMPRSVARPSGLGTLSIAKMRPAVQRRAES